jgi:hypothetical protein
MPHSANQSQEGTKNIVEIALAEFPAVEPPRSSYRFSTAAGALHALRTGTWKITPPGELNDPFEMWAGFDLLKVTEEATIQSMLAPNGLYRQMARSRFPAKLQNDVAYRTWVESAVKNHPSFRGPHLQSYIRSIKGVLSESFGIRSFSAFSRAQFDGELGIRHWAMYGDNHRGVTIEYDGEHELLRAWSETKWLFPVAYCHRRLLVELAEFEDWTDIKMYRTFRAWAAMKCRRAWGDEKEWRLTVPLGWGLESGAIVKEIHDGRTYYFMKLWDETQTRAQRVAIARVVRRVYFGDKINPAIEEKLLRVLQRSHYRHVQVYKVEPCDQRFALVSKPISLTGCLSSNK